MLFKFNVNARLSLDVKIDDKFLEFYCSYCKDMYDSAIRNSNINDKYISAAWKEVAKPYKKIGTFSKEEIEKILSDRDNWTTESECVTERRGNMLLENIKIYLISIIIIGSQNLRLRRRNKIVRWQYYRRKEE